MQCINLQKEGCVSEDPGTDQIYIMMFPEVSMLYRMSEEGNLFPTDSVVKTLRKREHESCCPVGAVQIMSGGVPEVLFSEEISSDTGKISEICEELLSRNMVPSCTPVACVLNGAIHEMGSLSGMCSYSGSSSPQI